MSGALLQQVRFDAQKIASSGGFEEDITLTTPDGAISIVVTGLTTGMSLQFDNEGNKVNTTKFHIDIPEASLIALDYPVRSQTSGKVKMTDHKVTVKDNRGIEMKFIITESYPNSTTGLIVCLLGRSE